MYIEEKIRQHTRLRNYFTSLCVGGEKFACVEIFWFRSGLWQYAGSRDTPSHGMLVSSAMLLALRYERTRNTWCKLAQNVFCSLFFVDIVDTENFNGSNNFGSIKICSRQR